MLYHLLSFFLKLLSRIPFKAMYVLSDGLFYLLYYVVRYRRPLVRKNLTESFPGKSEQEIILIEKSLSPITSIKSFKYVELIELPQK